MKYFFTLALLGSAALAPAAMASDIVELAKTTGCYSCHANAEKVVGPSFVAIAEKYKDDKDAVASLAQSIQNGSRGKWGRVPMPPHASLSAAELKALSAWVMTIRP
jgi:cytochrome c